MINRSLGIIPHMVAHASITFVLTYNRKTNDQRNGNLPRRAVITKKRAPARFMLTR